MAEKRGKMWSGVSASSRLGGGKKGRFACYSHGDLGKRWLRVTLFSPEADAGDPRRRRLEKTDPSNITLSNWGAGQIRTSGGFLGLELERRSSGVKRENDYRRIGGSSFLRGITPKKSGVFLVADEQ